MKAILVIDMPTECGECPLFEEDSVCKYCAATDVMANDKFKLKNCPLKPMPERMKVDYDTISSAEVTEKVVAIGWNACIDAMLGEE